MRIFPCLLAAATALQLPSIRTAVRPRVSALRMAEEGAPEPAPTPEAPAGWQIAVCGGCGGLGFWGTAFPLDTVKSRLQTQNARHPNAYRGVVDALRRIVREEGWLTLYNGYSTALVRAACTGGSVFFAYEYARALLG